MKETIKKTISTLMLASLLALPLSFVAGSSALASTAAQQAVCQGVDLTGSGGCDSSGSQVEVNSIIKTVINIFSLLVGVVAVIMIMVGGLKYVTSGGDGANTKSAKDTILYAVIGLVVVAMAQIIVKFVLKKVG